VSPCPVWNPRASRSLRGILRGFGRKVGALGKGQFAARSRELVAGQATRERIAGPLLRARAALRAEYATLHGALRKAVRADAGCRPSRAAAPWWR
jgi:hypothetical protein